MTRFKRWVRETQGIKLECDYDTLPYAGIDCVIVVPERAQVSLYHYGLGWVHWCFAQDGGLRPLTHYEENKATRAAVRVIRRREEL